MQGSSSGMAAPGPFVLGFLGVFFVCLFYTVNEWAQPCSSKILFTQTGIGSPHSTVNDPWAKSVFHTDYWVLWGFFAFTLDLEPGAIIFWVTWYPPVPVPGTE